MPTRFVMIKLRPRCFGILTVWIVHASLIPALQLPEIGIKPDSQRSFELFWDLSSASEIRALFQQRDRTTGTEDRLRRDRVRRCCHSGKSANCRRDLKLILKGLRGSPDADCQHLGQLGPPQNRLQIYAAGTITGNNTKERLSQQRWASRS